MAITPTFYISSLATPGTGDGTFGLPYALADLSIVGGTYKTVATTDIVAMLADGTYTPSANLVTVYGSANHAPILRGCKSDGSWDDTGATKAAIQLSGTFCVDVNGYSALVDVQVTAAAGVAGASALINVRGNSALLYNVTVDFGASTSTTSYAFYTLTQNNSRLIRCNTLGAFNAAFSCNRAAHLVYCVADGAKNGFTGGTVIYASFFAYCVAKNCTGFGIVASGNIVLHCLAYNCGQSGISVANVGGVGGIGIGCLSYNNGAAGYAAGSPTTVEHVFIGCAGYNNTTGLVTVPGSLWYPEDVQSIDSDFDAYLMALGAVPTLGHMLGAPAGRNAAGILTLAGSGGSGSGMIPMIGNPFLRRCA